MKTHTYYNIIAGCILTLLVSCNDGEMDRYPGDSLSPKIFFTSEKELRSYTNGFYLALPETKNIVYDSPYYADDDARIQVADEIKGSRVVPVSGGKWSWDDLRNINYFLQYSHQCEDEPVRLKYEGIARFFRAYFYLNKIQIFGDVPWYDYVLGMNDEGLKKPRDSRFLVFEKMLEDIDFAIQHLDNKKSAYEVNKWTALALKSRMCLFEGTFRKYHDLGDWESVLDKCIAASETLIDEGAFQIYQSTPEKAYQELFVMVDANPQEIIMARQYKMELFYHSVNTYSLAPSQGRVGVTRDMIFSYLMKNGDKFTDIPNYEKIQFKEECMNRDPRLAQTVRTPGYKRIGETIISLPDFGSCLTGYQYVKYVMSPSHDAGKCDNDMPIFRYAEVLLNFAEAKAERGTLSQQDLDKSIKRLRDRVGMPNISMADANQNPCRFLSGRYVNVDNGANKGIILEIRRERRIEIVREGHRWNDLMRWKEGHLLAEKFYGMYFPGAGQYDLDGNGTIDLEIYEGEKPPIVPGRQTLKIGSDIVFDNYLPSGQMWINGSIEKTWHENRDYLYPIPSMEISLNPNLVQNPNWVG